MDHLEKLPDQSWNAVIQMAEPGEVEAYLVDEILKALGLRADSRWRLWLRPFLLPFVRDFARVAAAFDQSVAQQGFCLSAKEYLNRWAPGLQIVGKEALPDRGPLLIVANHPGTFDGLAIASAISRQDLKIVAAANPFFRALPNTRRYFIYSTLDAHVRMATVRSALRHLQNGAVLLIFPSGKLDPDPMFYPRAASQSLVRWSASLEMFSRKAPQARLVVAINSGFVAPQYLHSPLARLRSSDQDKQKLAEFVQVIQQVIRNRPVSYTPSVVFTEPVSFDQLSRNGNCVLAQIMARAEWIIKTTPSGNIGQIPDRPASIT